MAIGKSKIINSLLDSLYNSPDDILDSNTYKGLLNSNNLLFRYDFLNRLLIQLQNKNAYDVKTEYEWSLSGQKIKENAVGIRIIEPVNKITYIEKSTGQKVSHTTLDLSVEEFKKAVDKGLIERVEEIEGIKEEVVYDISELVNTVKVNKGKKVVKTLSKRNNKDIEICRPKYRKYNLYLAYKAVIGKNCTIDYSNTEYKVLVQEIAKKIAFYIMKRADSLSYKEQNILVNSIEYSIRTMFGVKPAININIDTIDKVKSLEILSIVYSVISEIADSIEYTHTETLDNNIDVKKLHSAEKLLSVISAYDISNKVRQTLSNSID